MSGFHEAGRKARVLALGAAGFFLASSALAQERPAHAAATAASPAPAPRMTVVRAGQTPSSKAEATQFTGAVRRDSQFRAIAPGHVLGGTNTFEPGARSFWHSHPFGQTLIVTSGMGLTQVEGGTPILIRPGDVITVAPGIRHWQGAVPKTAMSHIAIVEADAAGNSATWGAELTEEAYLAADKAARAAEAAH